MNPVEALDDQPVDENDAGADAGLLADPEPAPECGPGQECHGDGQEYGEAGDAEQGMGEAEDLGLRFRHHRSTAQDWVDAAAGDVVRVFEEGDLLHGQNERGGEAEGAGNGQEPTRSTG